MRVKQRTWRVVIFWLALLACAPAARAQQDQWGFWQNGVTEAWWLDSNDFSLAEATGGVERWKAIGEERAADNAATEIWAGDYFRGSDTHGTYLRWSPQAGFVIAHVNKCAAQVMGLVYGRVEATPTLVQFFPELDKHPARGHGGHGAHQTPPGPRAVIRFVPVEWRGTRLLVAEDEMGDFGDYVAGLGSYNGWNDLFVDHTVFFSHSGAGSGEPDRGAPPSVPPGYEHFLKRPVEATLTSVGRRVFRSEYMIERESFSRGFGRVSLTYVTLDAGAEQGVKDHMVFRTTRPDEDDTVVVVRAGRRSSTAVVVRPVDERGRENFDESEPEKLLPKVARGWKLTTSPR